MEKKNKNNKVSRMERLLEENLEYNKKIFEAVSKTRSYMNYLRIINVFKLILIIVPLILALIYVPPFLQQVIGAYEDIFGASPFKYWQEITDEAR